MSQPFTSQHDGLFFPVPAETVIGWGIGRAFVLPARERSVEARLQEPSLPHEIDVRRCRK